MSYLALATDRFEEVAAFYGSALGFSVVDQWDRSTGRGLRFELGGMRLEILDNKREKPPQKLAPCQDRIQIVVEVEDIEDAYQSISVDAPSPKTEPWGARVFRLRDPDGVPVTYLEWLNRGTGALREIRGVVTSGCGRGQYFTRLKWAREQFADRLGIDPFPGTFNVILEEPIDAAAWISLRGTPGIRIDNPGTRPNDYGARSYPIKIDGVADTAIVLPEVESYPEAQIEIVAPFDLRNKLGKGDGDSVVIEILPNTPRNHRPRA